MIGDFTEDHAREFLQWSLSDDKKSGTLDDAAWARVYEVGLLLRWCSVFPTARPTCISCLLAAQFLPCQVCGGNALALLELSSELTFPITASNLDKGEHLYWEKGQHRLPGAHHSSC